MTPQDVVSDRDRWRERALQAEGCDTHTVGRPSLIAIGSDRESLSRDAALHCQCDAYPAPLIPATICGAAVDHQLTCT